LLCFGQSLRPDISNIDICSVWNHAGYVGTIAPPRSRILSC
jgi:hypothetical protein